MPAYLLEKEVVGISKKRGNSAFNDIEKEASK